MKRTEAVSGKFTERIKPLLRIYVFGTDAIEKPTSQNLTGSCIRQWIGPLPELLTGK